MSGNSGGRKTPELKFDRQGLLPVIVQDVHSRRVLMLAYMNREALEKTVADGRTWFYSRSRQCLWPKGETSGNVQKVRRIDYDCDADCLLVYVEQTGNACHTGEYSCFFRTLYQAAAVEVSLDEILAGLAQVIAERDRERPDHSHTAALLKAGTSRIAQKVGEEAVETVVAALAGERSQLVYEAADLIYHLSVLLYDSKVGWEAIAAELAGRSGKTAE